MVSQAVVRAVTSFITKAKKDISLQKVILFGSQARGDMHKQSDIDLIVVSPDFEDINVLTRMSTMYDYWKTLLPVDFICYTPKEYNEQVKRVTLARTAAREGKVMFSV
jgi:predicted nucleotidyltransferase